MTVHKSFHYGLINAVLLLAFVLGVAAQTEYEKTIQTARTDREAKLKADDGWLTVSGLFWLKEGANEFGADSSNDLVITASGAPAKIGTFDLQDGKVTLRVASGVTVTVDDKPVQEYQLQGDAAKKPEAIRTGDLTFLLLKRGARYGIRLKDKNAASRREFTGLRWYPVKEEYRVTAQFLPYDQPKDVPIINILGDVENYKSPGLLKFKLRGQEYTLEPVNSGEKLFLILRDQTSGKTTYAASRFLYADKPKDGQVILDFNLVINPPCAFTAYATCPLPPKQNRLNTAIEAGELIYQSHGEAAQAKPEK
ncbi:MAG: DUF1684 domain-containing protein [Blastocatellia bacterium]|nr:DUF1684 domain-containing protein [Blastocatellia bacterium]